MKINTLFAEKYRPEKLEDFIGNDFIVQKFSTYIKNKDFPHLLLFGKPGVGKTTLAKLLVKNTGIDFIYINASDENNIDTIRFKVKSFATTITFNNNIKAIILDECDYMTPNAQAALRNLMETTSAYTRFILTANYINRIIEPIISRCTTFEVNPLSKSDIARRVAKILENERIKFKLEDIALIINAHFPDLRKILNETQKNIKDNQLIINKNEIIESDYKLKIIDLLSDKKININEKFIKIRKLLLDNKIVEYSDLYSLLYENINKIFHSTDEYNETKARAIIVIAEQQYQDYFVVDKEINFMSCIVQLLQLLNKNK